MNYGCNFIYKVLKLFKLVYLKNNILFIISINFKI